MNNKYLVEKANKYLEEEATEGKWTLTKDGSKVYVELATFGSKLMWRVQSGLGVSMMPESNAASPEEAMEKHFNSKKK